MATSMVRMKWLLMKSFSTQKAEVLALIFILGALTIFMSLVWEAGQPLDGSYVDLSAKHQLELIERFKQDKKFHLELRRRQDELDEREGVLDDHGSFFHGHVAVPPDARVVESNFNLSKHLQENPHVISQMDRPVLVDQTANMPNHGNASSQDTYRVKPKKAATMIKYYDPNQGRMVYKPAIVEETELEGGPGQCRIYDMSTNITERYECMSLSIKPPTPICLYPTKQDIHISGHLREEGIWEPHIVRDFQNILYGDPDLAVIDIGANIGQYSLIAAAMGHKVIAVEPYINNIKRLHRAAQDGNLVQHITVLQNAISDTRKKWFLTLRSTNQGGVSLQMSKPNPDCVGELCERHTVTTIHMDDLLEVVTFKKAVMKIDIEGHEHRAFLYSSKLLKKVYIPYIFMEWMKLRQYHGSDITDTEDKTLTQRLVMYLTGLGYHAYSSVTMERLTPEWWVGWTDDIIWKHELHDLS